jgi:hypothetical protein
MTGAFPGPAGLADGYEADAVAAAVRSCPAVDDLCPGAWGGVVTYLAGRQVPGVRLTPDHLVISVRARWGVPAAEVAGQVRRAVAALAGPRRIDVVVADVADCDTGQPVTAGPAGERKMT